MKNRAFVEICFCAKKNILPLPRLFYCVVSLRDVFLTRKIKDIKSMFMMKKMFYTAPSVEVIEVAVEEGFALSGIVDGGDYGDGGQGSEMD